MPHNSSSDIDLTSPPFDRLKNVRPLATSRSGREGFQHARHQLYVGRDAATAAQLLVKVTTRPGLVYERNLANEIAALQRINAELPDSHVFPVLTGHGRLPDGRLYLTMYLFDELPLAASIDAERNPSRVVGHLRTAIAVARAMTELHRIPIFHVDLNPMNILHRVDRGHPVVRIVDFESSFDPARHGTGESYDPPTTSGFSAPEVSQQQPPDARADVFSLGAVLYTMLAGYDWTWRGDAASNVAGDDALDEGMRALLTTAVAPDPAARHASMDALNDALCAQLERIWPGRDW